MIAAPMRDLIVKKGKKEEEEAVRSSEIDAWGIDVGGDVKEKKIFKKKKTCYGLGETTTTVSAG